MLTASLPVRRSDDWGSGHFGAPRGDRFHNGVDFICPPNAAVRAVSAGTVTKIGHPYADGEGAYNSSQPYWYVEVTTGTRHRVRYLYVQPCVAKGQVIHEGQELGLCQSLQRRYPGISDHIHFEVYGLDDEIMDPDIYFARLHG